MTPGRSLAGLVALALLLAACGSTPETPRLTLRGVVVSSAGQALPGAVVTDGRVSTLTGEDGRFGLLAYERTITAVKPGFVDGMLTTSDGQNLRITLRDGQPVGAIALDRRGGGAALAGWRADLARRGFEVRDHAGGRPASGVKVLVLVTPALPSAEVAGLQDWVRAGGRLIVCAEWGGYPDQSLVTLNALVAPAGLGFSGATVKQPGGADEMALAVPLVTPASLAALVSSAVRSSGDGGRAVSAPPAALAKSPPAAPGTPPIYMAGATSVELDSGAIPVLRSLPAAYTVLAKTTAKALAAVGPLGKGKVFAVGDSSLWRDDASAEDGVPDWQRGANMALAAGLLRW